MWVEETRVNLLSSELMQTKIELLHELKGLREAVLTEKAPARRKAMQERGWKIRRLLSLSLDPKIEQRQIRALEIAEAGGAK